MLISQEHLSPIKHLCQTSNFLKTNYKVWTFQTLLDMIAFMLTSLLTRNKLAFQQLIYKMGSNFSTKEDINIMVTHQIEDCRSSHRTLTQVNVLLKNNIDLILLWTSRAIINQNCLTLINNRRIHSWAVEEMKKANRDSYKNFSNMSLKGKVASVKSLKKEIVIRCRQPMKSWSIFGVILQELVKAQICR